MILLLGSLDLSRRDFEIILGIRGVRVIPLQPVEYETKTMLVSYIGICTSYGLFVTMCTIRASSGNAHVRYFSILLYTGIVCVLSQASPSAPAIMVFYKNKRSEIILIKDTPSFVITKFNNS